MASNDWFYSQLKKIFTDFIEAHLGQSFSEKDLFKTLQLPSKAYRILKQILKDLEAEGLIQNRKKKWKLISSKKPSTPDPSISLPKPFTGSIKMHPKGFGFVKIKSPNPYDQDIFIPKHSTEGAIDGDIVSIEVNSALDSEKGPEGKVVSIIQRKRSFLVGTIYRIEEDGKIYAYSTLLGLGKLILIKTKKKVKMGDRVQLQVQDWGNDKTSPKAEVQAHLGSISDPAIDISVAVREFALSQTFQSSTLEEALSWGKKVPQKELKKRKDQTETTTLTIDPETAKDYDDALSIHKDEKGHFHLGVHIADVAHYVLEGSSLDQEARQRSNSTYFPGYCLPMLPYELSDHLCSLQPHVIRLTVSVLMEFNPSGDLVQYSIDRSYIKSAKRLSYEEAKKILDGELSSPHLDMLKNFVELSLLLKQKRYERGSIDFALPELIIIVNDKGVPYQTKRVEYDITHQLVEEFMLKANEVVAKHLLDKGKPVLFRIHEKPSSEDFSHFYLIAAAVGYPLPLKPTQQDLQSFFEKVQQTPYAQQLAIGFIRSLKAARYSPENIGHYGLALENYCHFTSPIRRYTDLIIQRLLFDEIKSETDYQEIADECSEKERISFKAEISVKLLKKLRLLAAWCQDNKKRAFEAFITKVKPFGLFFEVTELMLEGFLHISELENDYFVFNSAQNILVGQSTQMTHHIGKTIQVKPLEIDLITSEIQWELVVPKKQKRKPKK